MKKINYFFTIMVLFIVMGLSNKSYSQQPNPPEILNCDKYPTQDGQLNGFVDNLLRYNREFTLRMTSIYENLSPERQEVAAAYFQRGDTSLIDEFPQFDDQQLKDSRVQIRNEYLTVWSRHQSLFTSLESNQRRQIISDIIQCAGVKDEIQRELSGNRAGSEPSKTESGNRAAGDPCEDERIDCLISVASQSALMHAGCAGLDLSIIGGIICHGAAFTYHWAEGRRCNRTARRCREAVE
jgi:hypothetical protein